MLCSPALQLPTPSPAMHLHQQQGTAPDSCQFCEKQTARVRGEMWLTPRQRKEPNLYWTLLAEVRHCRKSCDHTHEAPGEMSQASLTLSWGGCSCNDGRITWCFQALSYPILVHLSPLSLGYDRTGVRDLSAVSVGRKGHWGWLPSLQGLCKLCAGLQSPVRGG